MPVEPVLMQEDPTPIPIGNEPPPPAVDPVGQRVTTNNEHGFSGKPGDFQKDMEILRQKSEGEAPAPIQQEQPKGAEPAQPEQPQAVETPNSQAIPEKFKNPDGTVNVERIEKSTQDADAAYEKYRQKEIQLQRTINNVNRQAQGLPPLPENNAAAVPVASQVPTAQPTATGQLDALIDADIKAGLSVGQVMAKYANALKDAAKDEALAEVRELKQERALDKRQEELERIAKHDQWVLTDAGIDRLTQIRIEKPWVNAAPHPWEAAHDAHLADLAKQQRTGSRVQMPTPKGATAPVPPAAPVNRSAPVATPKPSEMSKAQIDAHLNGKTVAEQDAYFKAMGLPGLPGLRRK